MNEPRSVQAVEDWGVVLQSVPSKNKKAMVKRLVEIFELDRQDAEQILLNLPLILVDNLSFGLAARIKKFFLTVGASVETTNHDMIKKNCYQVLWPQTPDLSFFMKHEAEASAQGAKVKAKAAGFSFFEKKSEKKEIDPEIKKPQGSPLPATPPQEPAANIPPIPPASVIPSQEPPATVPQSPLAPAVPVAPDPLPVFEEKLIAPSPSHADLDLERRASELNEKLRKFHAEKQELHAQRAEEAEKVKGEQPPLEEEKRKSDESARTLEELHQKEAQKQEELTREGEEWRSKAMALGEKVRELETNLTQKTTEVEYLIREKEDFAKAAAETQQELSALRSREQESSSKIERLERSVQEMTESLRSRNDELAQYEKQISKLAETISPPSRETKPDTEVPKPAVLFSRETVAELKKSPSYVGEKLTKEKVGHSYKSDLAVENTIEKPGTDEQQGKIIYIIRGDRRSDMLWYKIPDTDAERKAAEKEYGPGLTMSEVILKLTRKGWAVSHRDENVITFTSREKSFGSVTFPLK